MTFQSSMHLTFKAALATSVAFLFVTASPAYAADPNNPARIPDKISNYECVSDGWNIEVLQFPTGQDIVRFKGQNIITETLRTLPDGWAPDPYFPTGLDQATFFPDIVQDNTKPNNGRVCDTSDNSIIGYGQSYVVLKRNNRENWQNTQIEWEGDAHNLIGLSAGQVLGKFRNSLARQPNAGPLPPLDMCVSANPICFSASAPSLDRGPDAFAIMDMEMRAMEADITSRLGNDSWGEHIEDLNGLSVSWVKALESLGIVNTPAIRDNMRPRNADGGQFIFKKLVSNASALTLTVEPDEDLPLAIRNETGGITWVYPSKTTNPPGTSWPTSNHVDQLQPANFGMPGDNFPNPDYCPENDPRVSAYIPQYISVSDIVLELGSDIKYLTDQQMEVIESKGWKITEALKDWEEDDWQNSIAENPNMRRLTYDCEAPKMERSSVGQGRSASRMMDVNASRDGINCKVKDVAYYDALIEKMIVVNPVIGSLANHPCNQLRAVTGSMSNSISLPSIKSPAVRAPLKVVPKKAIRSQSREPLAPIEKDE